jgi:hypothetical protein
VIGAGFGRTGTQSLQLALNRLGFSCFHTKNLASELQQILLWHELAHRQDHGRDFEFSRMFGAYGYDATVDFPSCMYYKGSCLPLATYTSMLRNHCCPYLMRALLAFQNSCCNIQKQK